MVRRWHAGQFPVPRSLTPSLATLGVLAAAESRSGASVAWARRRAMAVQRRVADALKIADELDARDAAVLTNIFPKEASKAAKDLDEGDGAGTPALYGRCLVVSDLINVAGYPTSLGTPAIALARWLDHEDEDGNFVAERIGEVYPRESNAVAASLMAAGAVLVGKGNVDELGYGALSHNPTFGDVWSAASEGSDLGVGGADGGVAAAVAAGIASVGLGVDACGSLLVPASHCGVSAFRPTQGTYASDAGDALVLGRGSLGLVAVAADAVREVHAALCGAREGERGAASISDITLLLPAELWDGAPPVVRDAVRRLEDAGLRGQQAALGVSPTACQRAADAVARSTCAAALGRYLESNVPFMTTAEVVSRMADPHAQEAYQGEAPSVEAAEEVRERAGALVESMLAAHGAAALVAFPTATQGPPELGSLSQADAMELFQRNVALPSLLGLPCITVPVPSQASQPPAGLCLMGARGADQHVLHLATTIETCFR